MIVLIANNLSNSFVSLGLMGAAESIEGNLSLLTECERFHQSRHGETTLRETGNIP